MISPYCPIKCFTVKGFKSLQNVTITFTNPLFLVGKNGAGKSNVFEALSFLSACAASPLEDVFRTYGGIETVRYRGGGSSRPNNIFLRVDFALDNKKECYYQLEIIASKKYPFSVKREDCVIGESKFFRPYNRKIEIHPENVVSKDFIPTVTHQTLYLPLLSGIQKFNIIKQLLSNIQNFSINPSIAQDFQRPNTSMSLTSNGSNLTSIIDSMDKASLDRVCEYLGVLVPGIVSVKAKRHGKQLMVEFCQVGKNKKGVWHEAHVMSDGTMRLLGILTIFMQNNKPKVVCIEEPEATVHPGVLSVVLDLVASFAPTMQIIIATHSPELLDHKCIEADNIRFVDWREGKTYVDTLSKASTQSLQDHLMSAGELMQAGELVSEEAEIAKI